MTYFLHARVQTFFQSISNSRKKKLSRFVLTFLNPRKNSCTSPLNFTNFKTSLHLGIILRFLMERNRLRRSVSTILNPPLKAGKFVWITNNILNYLSYICPFARNFSVFSVFYGFKKQYLDRISLEIVIFFKVGECFFCWVEWVRFDFENS